MENLLVCYFFCLIQLNLSIKVNRQDGCNVHWTFFTSILISSFCFVLLFYKKNKLSWIDRVEKLKLFLQTRNEILVFCLVHIDEVYRAPWDRVEGWGLSSRPVLSFPTRAALSTRTHPYTCRVCVCANHRTRLADELRKRVAQRESDSWLLCQFQTPRSPALAIFRQSTTLLLRKMAVQILLTNRFSYFYIQQDTHLKQTRKNGFSLKTFQFLHATKLS